MNKEEATRECEQLAERMHTYGWEVIVCDNLGWFYYVKKDGMCVHPTTVPNGDTPMFHAGLSTDTGSGTPMFWYVDESFADPNDAVAAQVKEAVNFIANCQAAVNKHL